MSQRLSPIRSTILAVAVAASAACDDPTKPVATTPISVNSADVFALNGTSPLAPSAVAFFDGITVRTDQRFIFDVAFDIDAQGRVMVIPVRQIAPLGGGHPIGLQVGTGTFETITEAPRAGYRYDSTFAIVPGTPLIVETVHPVFCDAFSLGPAFYTKLVVTSIDQTARKIGLSFTVNPNCGFRSFLGPIPTH